MMKFIFDLDGTICFSGKPLSERIVQALDTLIEKVMRLFLRQPGLFVIYCLCCLHICTIFQWLAGMVHLLQKAERLFRRYILKRKLRTSS